MVACSHQDSNLLSRHQIRVIFIAFDNAYVAMVGGCARSPFVSHQDAEVNRRLRHVLDLTCFAIRHAICDVLFSLLAVEIVAFT